MRYAVLAIACLPLSTIVAWADEIRDRLDEAQTAYEEAIEKIERDVSRHFDDLIDAAANSGDFDKVTSLQKHKEYFLKEGKVDASPVVRTLQVKARSAVTKAYRDLRTAYATAISDYTKARNLTAAKEVRADLKQLEEQGKRDAEAGIITLPRKKKPAADKASPKPNSAPTGNPAPDGDVHDASKPAPAPVRGPQTPKSAPDASGLPTAGLSVEFLALLNFGKERDLIGDRLAPTQSRRDALTSLTERLYKNYPPMQWSKEECDYFVDFFSRANTQFEPLLFRLPEPQLDRRTGRWKKEIDTSIASSGRRDSIEITIYCTPYVQWLTTAPSVEEFIARAQHLQANARWTDIDSKIDDESLKIWLESVRFNNRGKVLEFFNKLSTSGVEIRAVKRLRDDTVE